MSGSCSVWWTRLFSPCSWTGVLPDSIRLRRWSLFSCDFISLLERTLISPERRSLLCIVQSPPPMMAELFLLTCSSFSVPPPCQKPLSRSPPPPPVCLSVCTAGELKCGLQAVASVIYKYENLLAQEISRANPSRPTEAALGACQRNVHRAGYLPNRPLCVLCLENGDDGWNSFQMLWNARVKLPSPALGCRVEPVTKGRPGSLRRPCGSQLINYHPVGSDTWRYYNGIWPHQPGTTE